MEPLRVNKISSPQLFLKAGLILLLVGMFFGVLGGLQYVIPGFLRDILSFEKIRPLHVSSVVFWILLAAMGTVLHYTQEFTDRKLFSVSLSRIQLIVFIMTITLILSSYILGKFGGREYWEFPPFLGIAIIAGWVLFVINFIKSIGSIKNQPVYVWMWFTGAIGFLFIFTESYLWLLPYFQQDIIRDMTVQWKSYGSLVGCWNMLIYGSGIYLMEKISKDRKYGRSKIAFSLYFLGLFNLFFNWSHHIYTLPISNNIKHVGYLVSMTELLILGRMIYTWRASLTQAQMYNNHWAFRFLWTADIWILINLVLAIAMSIPAVNVYTHGTHITVAHVMGTTIGINSMLLMAFVFDILSGQVVNFNRYQRLLQNGYVLLNVALFVFFSSLIVAGVQRSVWQMSKQAVPFSVMMENLVPYFIVFATAGLLVFIAFSMIIYPFLRRDRSTPVNDLKVIKPASDKGHTKKALEKVM
ncbi:MAG: cbb3-type cytochrome c oxidase subunit I [Cyclobacteriaceae bacterium]